MPPILILVIFLGVTIALMAASIKISLYLSMGEAPRTQGTGHVPAASARSVQAATVERQVYYLRAPYELSARYARGGLMVVAGILLLIVLATISILGSFHP